MKRKNLAIYFNKSLMYTDPIAVTRSYSELFEYHFFGDYKGNTEIRKDVQQWNWYFQSFIIIKTFDSHQSKASSFWGGGKG